MSSAHVLVVCSIVQSAWMQIDEICGICLEESWFLLQSDIWRFTLGDCHGLLGNVCPCVLSDNHQHVNLVIFPDIVGIHHNYGLVELWKTPWGAK